MPEEISFIHAADLHLDSPFTGMTQVPEHLFDDIQKSTFVALDNLVQAAIEKQVDFVLITGDLFDNEKQSLKAQIRLRNAFQELQKHLINVYISYGNHDFVNGNIHPITYPDNVHEFTNEVVSHFVFKRDEQAIAAIYGFSYEERAVHVNKAKEYEVKDLNIPFHIAMLHGSVSSNTEHDVYAPFQISDLMNSDFDYWALGHIHKRQVLNSDPSIVYPGNIQGRHRKETGEKGCYYVTLSPTNTEISFVSLEAIQFQNITVDVSNCMEIHQLETKIQDVIVSSKRTVPQLIHLQLTSNTPNLNKWETEKYLDEIVELVNESLVHHTSWSYIFRLKVERQYDLDENDLCNGEHFVGELMRHFDKVSIQPFLKDLYQHRKVRKYVETMSDNDEEMIKNEAKQLLIKELLKE